MHNGSYNIKTSQTETAIIKSLSSPIHKNLMYIEFSNGNHITSTKDHPFLSDHLDWISLDYKKTQKDYQFNTVKPLNVGSRIKTKKGFVEITNLSFINKTQKTYTIVELDKNRTFFANGILTGVETLKNH